MSPSRHLDDEQLSALVDGLAEPADVAHAASCPECTARIEIVGARPYDSRRLLQPTRRR